MSGFIRRKIALMILLSIDSPCGAVLRELPSDQIAFWRSEMFENYNRLQSLAGSAKKYTETDLIRYKVDASLCWHDSVTAYILVNNKVSGAIDFAFKACKDLFAPVVEAWNLELTERADAFNRWLWPSTGSALLELKLANDIPDTWDHLQKGIRPTEAYRLSPEEQRKSDEIKQSEIKLIQCVKKLPRPRKGIWLTVSSVLRSYVMACNEEIITLMGGAEHSKDLGLAFAIAVASHAANCRYESHSDENLSENERLVVCLP